MLEASEETIRPGRHQAQWGNGQDEPHKFQDADQDNAYLTELLSYSLDRLNKEPSLLLEDQSCIRRMMQDCAASHHSAFMEATKSLADVRDHMGSVNTHLRGMLEALPSLEEACASFSESSGQVVKRRQSHKQLQANHPQLLELLEVPQLMDTCVRNSNFDEALDLEAFVSKLAFLHPELKVVKGLHDEVKRISSAMRQQLLKRLSGSIQLPECLRIIGYLRRMSALTEPQLRLEFLRCREQWLAEQVSELDTQNPYDFLKKLTDIHRLHLFDIVMQHKAIFSDDTTANPEAHVAADAIILSSWAHHRVTQYLEALKAHLPRIKEGSSLSSVLEHSMYCGMSLGRVGLDFRPLLPPIFESCVANLFTMSLGNALDCFHAALEKHKWIAMPSVPSSIKRTSSKGSSAGSERSGAVPRDGDSEPSEDLSPPQVLMEHLPLAAFVNGLLQAFNELRHCTPLALRTHVAQSLQGALQAVCSALSHMHATRVVGESELPVFESACCITVDVVCPFIASCFGRLYPGSSAMVDTAKASESLKGVVEEVKARDASQKPANAPAGKPRKARAVSRTPSGKQKSGPAQGKHPDLTDAEEEIVVKEAIQ